MNDNIYSGKGLLPFQLNTIDDIRLAIRSYTLLNNRTNASLIKEAIELQEELNTFIVEDKSSLLKELSKSFKDKWIQVVDSDYVTKAMYCKDGPNSLISSHVDSMSLSTYDEFIKAVVEKVHCGVSEESVVMDVKSYRHIESEIYIPLLSRLHPDKARILRSVANVIEEKAAILLDKVSNQLMTADEIHKCIDELKGLEGRVTSRFKIAMELLPVMHMYIKTVGETNELERLRMYMNQTIHMTHGEISIFSEDMNGIDMNGLTGDVILNVLTDRKKQLEGELYIINGQYERLSYQRVSSIQSRGEFDDLGEGRQYSVAHIGSHSQLLRISNVKYYDKNYTGCTKIHAFIMFHRKDYEIICDKDRDGEVIYYAQDKDLNVFLTCSDITHDTIVLLPIYKEGILQDKTMKNLMCRSHSEFDISDALVVGLIGVGKCHDSVSRNHKLSEGMISVDSGGNVKLAFPRNASYMDKYASLHRIIIQLNVRKDSEDIKMILAEMFQLIDETEQVMRKHKLKKNKERKYRDAEKARMFLINDFKRSLGGLLELDPEFNFPKYYKDNEYDQRTYEMTTDSIIGIKRLIKQIMI